MRRRLPDPKTVTRIKALRAKGKTWDEIGATFGVTRDTAHRWGDEAYDEHRREQIERLRIQRRDQRNQTRDQIGLRPTSGASYPPEFRQRALDLAAEGMTSHFIADALGCDHTTIRRWLDPDMAKRQDAQRAAWRRMYRAEQKAAREAERQARRRRLAAQLREQMQDHGWIGRGA